MPDLKFDCTNCGSGFVLLEHQIPSSTAERPYVLVKCRDCGLMTGLSRNGPVGRAFSLDPPKVSWKPFMVGLLGSGAFFGIIHLILYLVME